MSTEGPTNEPMPDPSGVQAAIERYRDLAKYLVTVFAGVGALLLAGTQLSAVGSLTLESTPKRVIAALIGFVAAIGAVVWIVWKVLEVLRPVELSLDDVEADDELRPVVEKRLRALGPFDSVAELRALIQGDLLTQEQKEELLEMAATLVDQAAFTRVEKRFERARVQMLVGALVGTVGIVAFTWGANPPKSETADPIVRPLPTVVSVSLTDAGREVIGESLGKTCEEGTVAALSIGGTEEIPRIVTLPRNGCNPVQLSLQPEWGKATATLEAPAGTSGS